MSKVHKTIWVNAGGGKNICYLWLPLGERMVYEPIVVDIAATKDEIRQEMAIGEEILRKRFDYYAEKEAQKV